MKRLIVFSFLAALLSPAAAAAFGPATHATLTRKALGMTGIEDRVLPCPDAEVSARFVAWLGDAFAASSSGPEYRRRFPGRLEPFDLKGLLDLSRNPDHRAGAIDGLRCPMPWTSRTLVTAASVWVDTDGRNQERIAFGPDRRPLSGSLGPYPEDPAVLDMGGLQGLASQAHAHYALARSGLTGNPLALWTDPERFALAGEVEGGPVTFGPAMVAEHFMLALAAAGFPDPAADSLSLAFLGDALHYVQDASDPLHTVQVGDSCIVVAAILAWSGRAAMTGGGLFGDLKTFPGVGADVLSNHHLWTEEFWDREAVGNEARTPDLGDDERESPESLLARALVLADMSADRARVLGPLLYAAACEATSDDLRSYGFKLEDGAFDPADFTRGPTGDVRAIGVSSAEIALDASIRLLRTFETLRAWTGTPEGRSVVIDRLLAERLAAVSAREARFAAWVADHPEGVVPAGTVTVPWVALLEALAVVHLAVPLVVLSGRRRW